MPAAREKSSSRASPELLAGMREIAREEGRHFQEVLEEAMSSYIDSKGRESKAAGKVRPDVMAHYRASLEKNRLLAELLAR